MSLDVIVKGFDDLGAQRVQRRLVEVATPAHSLIIAKDVVMEWKKHFPQVVRVTIDIAL